MTRIIDIYRAQNAGQTTVDGFEIRIAVPVPDNSVYEWAQKDANTLCNALYSSLPGATIDALLSAMLTRRGTQLRVRLVDPEGSQQ